MSKRPLKEHEKYFSNLEKLLLDAYGHMRPPEKDDFRPLIKKLSRLNRERDAEDYFDNLEQLLFEAYDILKFWDNEYHYLLFKTISMLNYERGTEDYFENFEDFGEVARIRQENEEFSLSKKRCLAYLKKINARLDEYSSLFHFDESQSDPFFNQKLMWIRKVYTSLASLNDSFAEKCIITHFDASLYIDLKHFNDTVAEVNRTIASIKKMPINIHLNMEIKEKETTDAHRFLKEYQNAKVLEVETTRKRKQRAAKNENNSHHTVATLAMIESEIKNILLSLPDDTN